MAEPSFIDRLLATGDASIEVILSEALRDGLGSDQERKDLYVELANKALSGIPLEPDELWALDYGLRWETVSSVRPLILDHLVTQLRRQEDLNPGSTQVEDLDNPEPKEGESSLQHLQGMAPLSGMGLLSPIGRVAGSVAGKVGSLGVRTAVWPFKHKKITTLFAASGIGTFAIGQATGFEEGMQFIRDQLGMSPGGVTPPKLVLDNEELEDPDRPGFFTVHSATGRTVETPRSQQPKSVDTAGVNPGTYSPEMNEYMTEEDIETPQLIDDEAQRFGTLNEFYFGEIRLPLDTFPYGVDIRTGEAIRPDASGGFPKARRAPVSEGLRKHLPQEDLESAVAHKTVVPPGGQLNPSAFQKYGNDSLLSMVAKAAERHQVPVELLYGAINAQSGFIINAMTPDGSRLGLAQIDMEANPFVTSSQALNPRFAINWAAQQLEIGIGTYGNAIGGLASMMDPEDAKYLRDRGEFKNTYTEDFVKNAFGYAQKSGIGRLRFGSEEIPTTRGGGRGSGPTVPAYQAPDPATLKEIIRVTYQDLLERGATEEEAASSLGNLNSLFKDQYNSQVAKLQGKTSIAVDPQARFEEGIRGGGEFEFRQDTDETRDTMSFMGELVRVMQGV